MVEQSKRIVTSPNHRLVPVDNFGVRVNDNLAQLLFSIETIDDAGNEVVVREMTAVLTPKSLKVLSVMLTNIVANIESELGAIDIPESKLAELAVKRAS